MPSNILNVAIPSPLYHSFDYLAPAGIDTTALQPGMRIRVPFGARKPVGNAVIMHDIAFKMSGDEINAVTNYIQGLH